MKRARRLGVFGGTFDPPHVGHLALAEWAREEIALDRVVFVPAGEPPHKRTARRSAAKHRLAMTRLAVKGHADFEVSTIELSRRGPSYTVDTLLELARREPAAERFLIVGGDMFDVFAKWRAPELILSLATLVVALRPDARRPRRSRWDRIGRGVRWLTNPALDVSSSAIRARAAAGRSLRYLVPDAVARYATHHALYRSAA